MPAICLLLRPYHRLNCTVLIGTMAIGRHCCYLKIVCFSLYIIVNTSSDEQVKTNSTINKPAISLLLQPYL